MWKVLCFMAILCLAAAYDLKTGKIPNLIIAFGLVSGVLFSFLYGEPQMHLCILGAAVPFLLFPFFCLRLIGAGDVKLFMVIGSYLGCTDLIRSMGWMLLGVLIWMGVYFYAQLMKKEDMVIKEHGRRRKRDDILKAERICSLVKMKFPMAPGVLLGLLFYSLSRI